MKELLSPGEVHLRRLLFLLTGVTKFYFIIRKFIFVYIAGAFGCG